MKERDKRIDKLKGFAIFLVVLGHVIQATIRNYEDHLLYQIIYLFHMPFFVFLSGYSFSNHLTKLSNSFICRKVKVLLIPYVTWALVKSFFNSKLDFLSIITYFVNILVHPDLGLWFLWSLFMIYFLLFLGSKLGIQNFFLIIIYFILLSSILFFDVSNKFNIKQTTFLIPFFLLGRFFKTHKSRWISKFNAILTFILSVLIFILYFELLTLGIGNKFYVIILKYLIGGFVSLYFVMLLNYWTFSFPFLDKLGQSTLGIYAVHFYFLAFRDMHNILAEVVMILPFTIFVLVLSYYFVILVRRYKWLSYFLLGSS